MTKPDQRETAAPAVGTPLDCAVGRPAPERKERPPAELQCCFNCRAWKVRDWPHCQSSGPWGGKHAMPTEPGCVFMPATRSQMMTRHGYKRRPTLRSLPSDE